MAAAKKKGKGKGPAPYNLEAMLRDAIEDKGWTCYAIGRDAGVSPTVVKRFLDGQSLTTTSLAKILDALNIRLAVVGAVKPKKKGT
jgi:ribosome-binding protein aMBF1 (putative translation factor)